MLLDNPAGDVQPEAHAGEPSIVDVSRAVEALEHQRLILGRYADAQVMHAEPRLTIFRPDGHRDGRWRRTVLQCVFHQVGHHLFEARRIDRSEHFRVGSQLDPLPPYAIVLDQATDQRRQVDPLAGADQAAVLQA